MTLEQSGIRIHNEVEINDVQKKIIEKVSEWAENGTLYSYVPSVVSQN